jgi:hypothetical protein
MKTYWIGPDGSKKFIANTKKRHGVISSVYEKWARIYSIKKIYVANGEILIECHKTNPIEIK